LLSPKFSVQKVKQANRIVASLFLSWWLPVHGCKLCKYPYRVWWDDHLFPYLEFICLFLLYIYRVHLFLYIISSHFHLYLHLNDRFNYPIKLDRHGRNKSTSFRFLFTKLNTLNLISPDKHILACNYAFNILHSTKLIRLLFIKL
jgi:hypothetical protein